MADVPGEWSHGSPATLTALRPGSTVTSERALAEAFSHKPTLVSTDEHGNIRHNGRADGYLYRVAEAVGADDVVHGQGPEWHTRRPLRVTLVGPTRLAGDTLLSAAEEAGLRRLVAAQPRGERQGGRPRRPARARGARHRPDTLRRPRAVERNGGPDGGRDHLRDALVDGG